MQRFYRLGILEECTPDAGVSVARTARPGDGTYWGIRTDLADYKIATPLSAPADATIKLADTPTRLEAMPEKLQERLINWGYLVTDTAMRKHVDSKLSAATVWPFARGVV